MEEDSLNKHVPVYGFYIQRLAKEIKYLADDNLIKHKITIEQVKIISFISRRSELSVVYQKDIETEFGIKRSSVTNILQNIEKKGLIIREGDLSDARIKKVILTEEGKRLSLLLKNYINKLDDVIVNDMTTAEKEMFLQLLKRALKNVGELM